MTVVTLSTEQLRQIGEATTSPIVLVDPQGREVGQITQLVQPPDSTEEDVVAEIKRRMAADDGTRMTHAEVMGHLRALMPE